MFEVFTPRPVPELSITPLVKVKFVTRVPLTPLSVEFWMNTRSSETPEALVNETPLVELRIAPPVQEAADVQLPPLPETLKLPVVVLSTMPLAAPFDEMLWKVAARSPLLRLTGTPVVLLTMTCSETVSVPKLLPETPVPAVLLIVKP